MPKHKNPFDKFAEPKRHDVSEMLLSGRTISWDDILEVVGNFSPRTMGYVLRGLEDQGATILRLRDNEHGTLYRYDPNCEYDDRYRLSKPDGPDAIRQREQLDEKP
jgi:DNA-binding transcriptional ArsR family regulator|tara:strand:+ start:197 stop:514 length:318 start_codon:yes stop_codon:yes gene_type:complete